MRTCFGAALLLAVHAAAAYPQRVPAHTVGVYSCPFADSLLGKMRHGGEVSVSHRPGSDSFRISSNGPLFMIAMLTRATNQPERYPYPDLGFVVRGRQAQQLLASRPAHPKVTLILDDSVRIAMGDSFISNYVGPRESTVVMVSVPSNPGDALRLAHATKAAVEVDSVVQPIPDFDVGDFRLFYRFAACDSIRSQ
jgi:hypothetical protein